MAIHPLHKMDEELTVPQLEEKIHDLTKKFWMSHNPQVQEQISTFIEIYKSELEAQLAKQKVNQDPDSELDNLINIS
jgi:hypothetical protein